MTTNPPAIELTACVSSQIDSFGYDEATQTLAIKFPGKCVSPGAIYHYADVPADVFEAMKTAESVGKFFGSHIRGRYAYVKQPDPATGIVFGLMLEQEPKYTTGTKDGRLVNRSTGKPIPDDEPVFILRAQDVNAITALRAYRDVVDNPEHVSAVSVRIEAFESFALEHSERMKYPDTSIPQRTGKNAASCLKKVSSD